MFCILFKTELNSESAAGEGSTWGRPPPDPSYGVFDVNVVVVGGKASIVSFNGVFDGFSLPSWKPSL